MNSVLAKIFILREKNTNNSFSKILLLEVFKKDKKRLILAKKIDIKEDLILTLDKMCRKFKIRKLNPIEIMVICGEFNQSLTCRTITIFQKTLELVR
jgi:hypothetical protein